VKALPRPLLKPRSVKATPPSRDYLEKLGGLFGQMAEALENAIRDQQAKRFFDNLD